MDDDTDERRCGGCGRPVTAWPYVVVPRPGGVAATYHEACAPWTDAAAAPEVGGLDLLSGEELGAVVGVVEALVAHDEDALRRVGARAGGADPYEPTRRWRRWPEVDLVVPPGDPVGWEAEVIGSAQGWAVDIRMWTVQEGGPSDLVLHLDVDGPEIHYRGLWT